MFFPHFLYSYRTHRLAPDTSFLPEHIFACFDDVGQATFVSVEGSLATPRRLLRELAAQRHGDPLVGLTHIDELDLDLHPDPEISGQTILVRALLLREVRAVDEAKAEFEAAISWGGKHDLPDLEARARANLATMLADRGDERRAHDEIRLASRIAPDSAKGLVEYLDGLLHQRRGRHHEALAKYEAAVPLLLEDDDAVTVHVLRMNRGIALTYLGDLDKALEDFTAAESAAEELGLKMLAAMAAHNVGFLFGRLGNLADALAAYDRAEARYNSMASRPKTAAVVPSDRGEVLLQAGLAVDARVSVSHAVEMLEVEGMHVYMVEAQLLLARSCLAAGDLDDAKRHALAAARNFRSDRRFPWVSHASFVGRQVDYRLATDGVHSPAALSHRFEYLSGRLLRHGWPVEGRDALVFGALASLRDGAPHRAESLLKRARAIKEGNGAVQHQARFNLARALLLRSAGRQDRAAAVIRRGVEEALDVLTTTGSTEARTEALRFAGELAALGTSIALERGGPTLVLRAVERQRSLATAAAQARVGTGADLAEALTELRSNEGSSAEAERAVREQSLRSRPGPGQSTIGRRLSWRDLRSVARRSSLVYFLDVDGFMRALIVRERGTRLVDLAERQTIIDQVGFVQFALQRLALVGSEDRHAAAGLNREVQRLHSMLIGPLDLPSGPIVVVPEPGLNEVQWSLLAAMAEPITLAASGHDWLEAKLRKPSTSEPKITLIGGPGLEAAEAEVQQIATFYDKADVLLGDDATVEKTLHAFATADIVHVASHGLFRAESPMFSRLELSNGPLTIYDLERVERLPPLVVLSACEAAAGRHYPSGGALGTAAALTALGARTVVAPIRPVPDAPTLPHMVRFHHHLRRGRTSASALKSATDEALASNDSAIIEAAAAFVAIGAD